MTNKDDGIPSESPLLLQEAIDLLDELGVDVVQGVGATLIRHSRGTTEAQRLSGQAISPVIRLEGRHDLSVVVWAEARWMGGQDSWSVNKVPFRICIKFLGPRNTDRGRADFYPNIEPATIVAAIQGHLL